MLACISKLKERPYQLYREGLLELGEIMKSQFLLEAEAIVIQVLCHEKSFEKAYQCGKILVENALDAIGENKEERVVYDFVEPIELPKKYDIKTVFFPTRRLYNIFLGL